MINGSTVVITGSQQEICLISLESSSGSNCCLLYGLLSSGTPRWASRCRIRSRDAARTGLVQEAREGRIRNRAVATTRRKSIRWATSNGLGSPNRPKSPTIPACPGASRRCRRMDTCTVGHSRVRSPRSDRHRSGRRGSRRTTNRARHNRIREVEARFFGRNVSNRFSSSRNPRRRPTGSMRDVERPPIRNRHRSISEFSLRDKMLLRLRRGDKVFELDPDSRRVDEARMVRSVLANFVRI